MKRFIKILWCVIGGLFAVCLFFVLGVEWGFIGNMPKLDELENPVNRYASQVVTADGKSMGMYSRNENRVFVGYDSIAPAVIDALIAVEDTRYFDHSGVDVRSLGRAIVKRGFMGQKEAGGGSTITQQLAKQLYTEQAQNSFHRMLQKPIEWIIAIELERRYTKEEIITMYLNYFDFLHNAKGLRTAAKVYFNTTPSKLTVPEAATLVGMCQNPSYFNPISHNERCRERRNVVFQKMVKAGTLTQEECDEYSKLPLDMKRFQRISFKEGCAPYVREYLRRIMMADEPVRSDYVKKNAKGTDLQKQNDLYRIDSLAWATDPLYGWCKKNHKADGSNYDIYSDGLKIYTTIDSRMQKYAEEAMYEHVVKRLQPAFDHQKAGNPKFPYVRSTPAATVQANINRAIRQSERFRILKAAGWSTDDIRKNFDKPVRMKVFTYDQGEVEVEMTPRDSIRYYKSFLRSGMMSIDPHTGYVKAYVGGLDFDHFQYDMCMVGRRQVGSTMKPFVYTLAMEDGRKPSDKIPCRLHAYYDPETGFWWKPTNGASRGGGEVTLKWGLSQSNNFAAAEIMWETDPTGVGLMSLLNELGIIPPGQVVSAIMALGASEITVGEMASAYTMFVNEGVRSAPTLVTKIEDSEGNVVARFAPRYHEVIKTSSSHNMIDMMRGVVDAGTGRGVHSYVHGPVAGKTGTTNNNADAWFIGCVPRLVTACWVGGEERDIHFNSMAYGQGAKAALPIWGLYMRKVYNDSSLGYKEGEPFTQLASLTPVEGSKEEAVEGITTEDLLMSRFKTKALPKPTTPAQGKGRAR